MSSSGCAISICSAKDRFNRLVLIFGYEDGGYMAPLYPYFFDVDGFPDVRVVGLTPEAAIPES